jgi:hypothetical protein
MIPHNSSKSYEKSFKNHSISKDLDHIKEENRPNTRVVVATHQKNAKSMNRSKNS